MINKKNLWFVTLFSIILVLSIFYVEMSEDDVKSLIENKEVNTEDTSLVVKESTELVALRVQSDEEVMADLEKYQNILLSEAAKPEEKSEAYTALLNINNNKGLEQELEKIIKKEFKYDSFVKINSGNVTVVVDNNGEHNYEIANKIIRRIQKEFDKEMYITVKFS